MRLMAKITQARLKELLNYDPETGLFVWRVTRRVKAGTIAGSKHPTQHYIAIKIDGVLYKAHRLAWLYEYGIWPPNEIDHINRVRTDNRLENIRLATKAENAQNRKTRTDNSSGMTGVSWHKRDKKWRVYIGKGKYLGYFDALEDAIAARKEAEKLYFTHSVC
jgi:hypothetical protein